MRFTRLTVIGCGQIGGSFALAFRRIEPVARIRGFDISDAAIKTALRRGVIDAVDDAFQSATVSESDLIYLAMPVAEIIKFLATRCGQVKPGALISDAGSTKADICRAAKEHVPPDRTFIGGHPIAGTERSGISNARADLFTCAPYVLTDSAETGSQLKFKKSLIDMGARVRHTTSDDHDRALALVSHLPQLLSTTLAATIRNEFQSSIVLDLAGTGLRGMTRLASSPWPIWRDIIGTNSEFIGEALKAFIDNLNALQKEVANVAGDRTNLLPVTNQLFEEAKKLSFAKADNS